MNKKILLIILLIAISVSFYAFYAFAGQNQNKEVNVTDKKILIAYYSRSGNTKSVAEKIQTVTGGDLFEIKTKKEYPKSYDEIVNQAKIEKVQDIRPELVNNGNIKDYDIIFVGTPVWWYTMASPIKTFLSVHNFEGKIIVPFCTHGGGGASSTYSDMKNIAKGARILEGFTSYENSAKLDEIKKWINNANL